ncbi:lysophospholipid acyltransferase family protein [Thiomicrorhabdus sediminis]|uniref:1-acyl-sn-glycerol-3-phosphate acyltransferase n=1 Tax=Thiomicrorhabdus sediminis TaxID=2580412 RepID=A0A4P9K4Y2_9GAMM|nr:lysophospholipid acyltransferase family protein [Thiomicrorhabdus sediminis]QCU89480.1 1-acyl-sn-glycerol-3-phosphate acyltransferase [Thiomicrorhabdus sediminis]
MKMIYFLRSVLFSIGQVSTLVLFSLLGQFTRPFSFATRYNFMRYWAHFCIWWVKITCGIKYNVHGADNINTDKAGLILARHESAWETFALQEIFPRQAYVLKRELLKIPFFGWGMALLRPIAIDRGAGRQALNQLVKEGQQRLQDGDWVVVFPEGTRMPSGKLGKINIGGAMLASKAGAPVYLVAHNAGSVWPKNSFIKKPGVVDIYISEPLDASAMSAAEINQQIESWFSQHLVLADKREEADK